MVVESAASANCAGPSLIASAHDQRLAVAVASGGEWGGASGARVGGENAELCGFMLHWGFSFAHSRPLSIRCWSRERIASSCEGSGTGLGRRLRAAAQCWRLRRFAFDVHAHGDEQGLQGVEARAAKLHPSKGSDEICPPLQQAPDSRLSGPRLACLHEGSNFAWRDTPYPRGAGFRRPHSPHRRS